MVSILYDSLKTNSQTFRTFSVCTDKTVFEQFPKKTSDIILVRGQSYKTSFEPCLM